MEPLSVSVIIPCWNAEKWIQRTVLSALDQRYSAIDEVIVIDDGSSDGSVDILRSFGSQIRWETGPNRGPPGARNRGLDLAVSKYVLFLDSDDYLEQGSLRFWAQVAQQSDADIVFGPFAYEWAGTKERRRGQSPPQPVSPHAILCEWLEGWFTPPCSILWRRSFLEAIGGWNPAARRSRSDDGELAMRAMLSHPRISVSRDGLGIYVQHDSPDRVSRRIDGDTFACELALLKNLCDLAQARGEWKARPSFGRAFYHHAYQAFAARQTSVGAEALAKARELGLRGHIGPARHQILSSLLGLRRKMQLSGMLRARLSMLRRNPMTDGAG